MSAPARIIELVDRFHRRRDEYRRGTYNETQARVELINPLFEELGWDIEHRRGGAREVKHEDRVEVAGKAKAPDYGFHLNGRRVFFVEAKKPAVDLAGQISPAYQLRRYAWSAKLPVSVLTDFEEFAVYDTRVRPRQEDKPAVARVLYHTFDEYLDRWDDLAALFGRDAVLAGSLEQFAEKTAGKKGAATVDSEFLAEIERWRDLLARHLAVRNPALDERGLNFAVQQTIDRLLFLRIAEDRGIEPYGALQGLLDGPATYDRLLALFTKADGRYNSGLFHFGYDRPGRDRPNPDLLTPRLAVDDKPLKDILRNLYPPASPYEFSVFPAEVLGQVYEQFLGKVIRLTDGHRAKVEEKPEVRKAGGVYYTPGYIVDYIVRQTVGKLVEDHTPAPDGPVSRLRILDPACGSGSFLIGAYQFLLDWHLAGYVASDPEKWRKRRVLHRTAAGEWVLSLAERKRILLDNLYGVDIDAQAVEVTKLSLLLKVLEGDPGALSGQLSLLPERALPDLGDNIKCGNSLIGPDFYEQPSLFGRAGRDVPAERLYDIGEQLRVNAFDWRAEFKDIMAAGGFDAVIGNPPYVRQEVLKEYKGYFEAAYQTFRSTADLYVGFMEKGHALLRPNGRFGMIVSNKWLRAAYGKPLREFLAREVTIEQIVDFAGLPVFPQATVRTIVIISRSSTPTGETIRYLAPVSQQEFQTVLDSQRIQELVEVKGIDLDHSGLTPEGWSLISQSASNLVYRLREKAVPLKDYIPENRTYRGLITGLNEAFILTENQRQEIIAEDPKSAEIIKPVLGGREVRRYGIDSKGKYIIWTYIGVPIKRYPAIFRHLKSFQSQLEPRWDKGNYWWELRACDYYDKFEQPKIIYPDIATTCRFTLDTDGYFSTNTTYFIPGDDLYLLGLLNSSLAQFYFTQVCAGLEGGDTVYLRFFGQYLDGFPVRVIDLKNPHDLAKRDKMIQSVRVALDLNKKVKAEQNPQVKTLILRQIENYDRQINQLVFGLYGLTSEEIAIIGA
jgi:hypothetical protein